MSAAISRHSPWRLTVYNFDGTGQVSFIAVVDLDQLNRLAEYRELLAALKADADGAGQSRADRERHFSSLIDKLRPAIQSGTPAWLDYRASYMRNAVGRVTSIDSPGGPIVYTYETGKADFTRQLPNGVTTRFAVAPGGTLTGVEHRDRNGALIGGFRYRVPMPPARSRPPSSKRATHRCGSITSEMNARASRRCDRATAASRVLRTTRPDAWPRPLTGATALGHTEYDPAGRPTEFGGTTLEWNPRNELARIRSAGTATDLRYDMRGLLKEASDGDVAVRFEWDAEGHVIARTEGGRTECSLPMAGMPGGRTLVEYGPDGRPAARYTHSGGPVGVVGADNKPVFFLEGPDGESRFRVTHDGTYTRVPSQPQRPELPRFNKGDWLPGPLPARPAVPPRPAIPDVRIGVADRSGQFWDRVRENIDRGAALPMPDEAAIAASDGYWTSRAYERDAYYTNLPPPLARLNPEVMVRDYALAPVAIGLSGVRAGLAAWGNDVGASLVSVGQHLAERGMSPEAQAAIRPGTQRLVDVVEFIGAFTTAVRTAGEVVRGGTSALVQAYDPGRHRSSVFFDGYEPGSVPIANSTDYVGSAVFGSDRALGRRGSLRELIQVRIALDGPGTVRAVKEWFRDLAVREIADAVVQKPGPDAGRHSGASGSWLRDPFGTASRQLGGVELAATARLAGRLGRLSGATYDAQRQALILVGDTNVTLPALRAEDLALALRMAYAERPIDARFSLDPADPANPRGPWLKAVYLPENVLAGTSFGQAMFEADWLLKQASSASRSMRRAASTPVSAACRGSRVWRHSPLSDRPGRRESPGSVSGSLRKRSRCGATGRPSSSTEYAWACGRRSRCRTLQRGAACATSIRLTIRWRPNSPRSSRPATTNLLQSRPNSTRVRELAKAVALAKWLRAQNVPIDRTWVDAAPRDPRRHRRAGIDVGVALEHGAPDAIRGGQPTRLPFCDARTSPDRGRRSHG